MSAHKEEFRTQENGRVKLCSLNSKCPTCRNILESFLIMRYHRYSHHIREGSGMVLKLALHIDENVPRFSIDNLKVRLENLFLTLDDGLLKQIQKQRLFIYFSFHSVDLERENKVIIHLISTTPFPLRIIKSIKKSIDSGIARLTMENSGFTLVTFRNFRQNLCQTSAVSRKHIELSNLPTPIQEQLTILTQTTFFPFHLTAEGRILSDFHRIQFCY